MKRNMRILMLLIVFVGCRDKEISSNNNLSKAKTNYIVMKEDVAAFANKSLTESPQTKLPKYWVFAPQEHNDLSIGFVYHTIENGEIKQNLFWVKREDVKEFPFKKSIELLTEVTGEYADMSGEDYQKYLSMDKKERYFAKSKYNFTVGISPQVFSYDSSTMGFSVIQGSILDVKMYSKNLFITCHCYEDKNGVFGNHGIPTEIEMKELKNGSVTTYEIKIIDDKTIIFKNRYYYRL